MASEPSIGVTWNGLSHLALGSNLGDRASELAARPAARWRQIFELGKCSRLYETEPAYVLDQPRFYNQVCQATTELAPLDALHRLKAIEAELGRVASSALARA